MLSVAAKKRIFSNLTLEKFTAGFTVNPKSHLPLVLLRLALELDQPVLLAVAHGTMVHGDDGGPRQQGPRGPTAHYRAQHSLTVIHRRPRGAKRGKKHIYMMSLCVCMSVC